ncbi:hypothetical protein ACQUY5_26230 [Bacillus cereus]|uniref:hypothetical protein n=1 Tax=Bacillus cereus TaxID=1396 RepID=UPI003D16EBD9
MIVNQQKSMQFIKENGIEAGKDYSSSGYFIRVVTNDGQFCTASSVDGSIGETINCNCFGVHKSFQIKNIKEMKLKARLDTVDNIDQMDKAVTGYFKEKGINH